MRLGNNVRVQKPPAPQNDTSEERTEYRDRISNNEKRKRKRIISYE